MLRFQNLIDQRIGKAYVRATGGYCLVNGHGIRSVEISTGFLLEISLICPWDKPPGVCSSAHLARETAGAACTHVSTRHREEPTGRANARPMTGSATKQSIYPRAEHFARNDGEKAEEAAPRDRESVPSEDG